MRLTLTFTHEDDDGCEVEHELPARYEVCDRCEGHGCHLTPSIGEHAYSMEEFHEAFDDEEDRAEYFKRGGRYDVPCEECKGKRVVLVLDESACFAEHERVLALYHEREAETAAYERQRRDEIKWGY
jgi:RecJ-like exonuclease